MHLHAYLHTGPELPLVEEVGAAILVIQHTEQSRQPDVIIRHLALTSRLTFMSMTETFSGRVEGRYLHPESVWSLARSFLEAPE